MSRETFSRSWPECLAMISSSRRLMPMISRAWISMSLACPWKPLETWWMRILAFGSAIRLPSEPHVAAPRHLAHHHPHFVPDQRGIHVLVALGHLGHGSHVDAPFVGKRAPADVRGMRVGVEVRDRRHHPGHLGEPRKPLRGKH